MQADPHEFFYAGEVSRHPDSLKIKTNSVLTNNRLTKKTHLSFSVTPIISHLFFPVSKKRPPYLSYKVFSLAVAAQSMPKR